MNGENRKGRVKAPQNNPLPAPRQREGTDDMACCGYAVLDRASLSRFNKERRGLGTPISDDDGQHDDFSRYGYLP